MTGEDLRPTGDHAGETEPGWKKLKAWQVADELAVQVVLLTRQLRGVEFSLLSQINRSATSVPANIVEGYCRLSLKEYLHHLSIARASLGETQYFIHFFRRMEFFSDEQARSLAPLATEAGKLLYGLIRSLANKLAEQNSQNTYMIRETPETPYGEQAPYDFDTSSLNP